MGLAFSEEQKPPPVILVPPKFYRDHHTLDKLFMSPLTAWLTSPERRRLFGKGVPSTTMIAGGSMPGARAFAAGSWGRLVLTPPQEPGVVVDASLTGALTGQLSLRAYPLQRQGDYKTAVELLARIQGEDSGVPLVRGSYFMPLSGGASSVGVVAGASTDVLMNPALLLPPNADSAVRPDSVRMSPGGPPQESAGAFVGLRYHSEAASAGVIVHGVPPNETNLQSMGAGGEALAWVMGRQGGLTMAAETNVPLNSASLPPSPTPPSLPFKYGLFYAGMGWDAALIADSRTRSTLLGFYIHQVMRRKVQNPFERSDVVGIANYLDLGVEVRWQSLPPTSSVTVVNRPPAVLDLAGSWQLNKNWLVKGSISSSGLASMSAMLRSWTTPAFTLGCSVVADLKTHGYAPGLSLVVENTGDIVYERPSRNTTFSHPTVETVASQEEVREGSGKRPLVMSLGADEVGLGRENVGPRVTFIAGGNSRGNQGPIGRAALGL